MSTRERIKALREKRAKIFKTEMEARIERAGDDPLDGDDLDAYEKAERDVDNLTREIDVLDRQRERELGNAVTVPGVMDLLNSGAGPRYGVPLTGDQRFADLPGAQVQDRDDASRFWRALGTGDFRSLPEHLSVTATSEVRDVGVGLGFEGGYTIPLGLSAQVWDLARAEAVTAQAGMQYVPITDGQQSIITLKKDASPTWVGETGPVSEDGIEFGVYKVEPLWLTVLVKASMQILADSNYDIGSLITASLAKSFALEIDRASLFGEGLNQEPAGILSYDTVGETTGIGANLAWSHLADAHLDVESRNYKNTAFIENIVDEANLSDTLSSTGDYVDAPPIIRDVPRYTSNQVPTNLGGGSDESIIVCGDWSQAYVAVRAPLTVVPLRERFAAELSVGFLAYARLDVAVPHPEAFHVIRGITR